MTTEFFDTMQEREPGLLFQLRTVIDADLSASAGSLYRRFELGRFNIKRATFEEWVRGRRSQIQAAVLSMGIREAPQSEILLSLWRLDQVIGASLQELQRLHEALLKYRIIETAQTASAGAKENPSGG